MSTVPEAAEVSPETGSVKLEDTITFASEPLEVAIQTDNIEPKDYFQI
jgi:hypothetical protein